MPSPSTTAHRDAAAGATAGFAVLTVSDTRTPANDSGGDAVVGRLAAAGHAMRARAIVRDEPADVEAQLRAWIADPAIEVVITTGGTGIASRDGTVEVVERLLDKRLDGFGELFRMLSYVDVGPAAMLSRAVGGLAGETLVFALPGSLAAVTLALEKLIVPELPHLVWERRR